MTKGTTFKNLESAFDAAKKILEGKNKEKNEKENGVRALVITFRSKRQLSPEEISELEHRANDYQVKIFNTIKSDGNYYHVHIYKK